MAEDACSTAATLLRPVPDQRSTQTQALDTGGRRANYSEEPANRSEAQQTAASLGAGHPKAKRTLETSLTASLRPLRRAQPKAGQPFREQSPVLSIGKADQHNSQSNQR